MGLDITGIFVRLGVLYHKKTFFEIACIRNHRLFGIICALAL